MKLPFARMKVLLCLLDHREPLSTTQINRFLFRPNTLAARKALGQCIRKLTLRKVYFSIQRHGKENLFALTDGVRFVLVEVTQHDWVAFDGPPPCMTQPAFDQLLKDLMDDNLLVFHGGKYALNAPADERILMHLNRAERPVPFPEIAGVLSDLPKASVRYACRFLANTHRAAFTEAGYVRVP